MNSCGPIRVQEADTLMFWLASIRTGKLGMKVSSGRYWVMSEGAGSEGDQPMREQEGDQWPIRDRHSAAPRNVRLSEPESNVSVRNGKETGALQSSVGLTWHHEDTDHPG